MGIAKRYIKQLKLKSFRLALPPKIIADYPYELGNELKELYVEDDIRYGRMACLIGAASACDKAVFILTQKGFNEILKSDPNRQFGEMDLRAFNEFLALMEEMGALRVIKEGKPAEKGYNKATARFYCIVDIEILQLMGKTSDQVVLEIETIGGDINRFKSPLI